MTVEGYINGLGEPGAGVLRAIRATVLKSAPDATEAIKYDMPVFRLGNQYIFYLGGWKRHAAIYPIPRHYSFEAELAPYRSGKDGVRFAYNAPVPLELVARIVEQRVSDILNR